MTKLLIEINIPGQEPHDFSLVSGSLMIGTLLSNQVVIRAEGVEPIHAMFEDVGENEWVIADLGSQNGVYVNGGRVDVEQKIQVGDEIQIGSAKIKISEEVASSFAPPPPPVMPEKSESSAKTVPAENDSTEVPSSTHTKSSYHTDYASVHDADDDDSDIDRTQPADDPSKTVRASESPVDERRSQEQLFSPRSARPTGSFLECVSYWDDTVLEVELFHPSTKDYQAVIVGDQKGAHFPAGGLDSLKNYMMANFTSPESYRVRLAKDMVARIRKDGKVTKVEGPAKFNLKKRDLVHITHGAVKYFLLFVRPPVLNIPRKRPGDPLFNSLFSVIGLLYLMVIPYLIMSTPVDEQKEEEQFWEYLTSPNQDKKPPVVKKEIIKPKPQKEIAKIKKDPPKTKPPKIQDKKVVKPVKPKETEKIKQPKPTKNPVKQSNNISDKLQKKSNNTKANTGGKSNDNKKSGGMAKGAGKPDFKLVGPKTNGRGTLTGGNRGQGNNKAGGARKGSGKISVKGVEGPKNNKASGVNLKSIGFGSGLSLNKDGAGAIRGFKSTVGGSGGGSGSAARTTGMGGPGSRGSVGISGSGGAGNFGAGTGGLGSGQGGSGGLGGSGLGTGFGRGNGSGGRGRPNITTPAGGIVASEGLTQQEIQSVIRANINQIRACYEVLLRRSKNAAGKVKAAFTIGTTGRVTAASIAGGTLNDTTLHGCITGKIRRWKFNTPRGGKPVNVTYPFVFNPS